MLNSNYKLHIEQKLQSDLIGRSTENGTCLHIIRIKSIGAGIVDADCHDAHFLVVLNAIFAVPPLTSSVILIVVTECTIDSIKGVCGPFQACVSENDMGEDFKFNNGTWQCDTYSILPGSKVIAKVMGYVTEFELLASIDHDFCG